METEFDLMYSELTMNMVNDGIRKVYSALHRI